MLQNGIVYLRPETPHFAISTAHTEGDMKRLVEELEEFIRGVKGN